MKLLIVWKSDNNTDINNFIYPYAFNSKKNEWFDDVEVLIWGASQEKVMNDQETQGVVQQLIENNITIYACKWCSDKVGASELLSSLGVNVMYTGVYLTEKLQDKEFEVITI